MVFAASEQGTQYQEVRAILNCLARNQTNVSEQLAYSRTVVSVSYHYKDQTKHVAGADLGFQVRGEHLKSLRPAEGGAKHFGVFRVKNLFFSNLRWGGAPGAPPPPGSAPVLV